MPRFGLCTSTKVAAEARAAGWDYLEVSVQAVLQGDAADDVWTGAADVAASALPAEVANLLLPATLPVVGPNVDEARIDRYLGRVMARAGRVGIRTIVFGAGGARRVPDGFDASVAHAQLVSFARRAGDHGAAVGVTLAIEPLNHNETNTINTVADAFALAAAVAHPNVRCLVDSYHLWVEGEPLAALARAMPAIAHVHVADEHGRVAPGEGVPPSDYGPFFATLKRGGYDGRISVEARGVEPSTFARVLTTLRDAWQRA